MNNLFLFFVLFCFLFPEKTLLTVGESEIYDYNFYQQVPMSEWASFDSTKKERALNSFIEKELVFHEALKLGLDKHSKTQIQLMDRFNQLLVNEYYEKAVAAPLINKNFLSKTKNFVLDKVFVFHILIGFEGSSLQGSFKKTKKEALDYAFSLKGDFLKKTTSLSADEKTSLFSTFASSFSDDPSAKTNAGELGWVSWGRTMPSFQNVAFNSKVLSVSDPVLTDYGYHLIFVSKKGFSDFYYYNKEHADDMVIKLGLQSVSLDSLRAAASAHDSLLFAEKNYSLNFSFVSDLIKDLNKKTKEEGLRGGKNLYVGWLQENKNKEVLFFFNGENYGLGWFINKLKKTPGTRVPILNTAESFDSLLRSFILQNYVVFLAKQKGFEKNTFFVDQFLNHKKNILFKKYESYLFKNSINVDSSVVKNLYNKGVFKGEYIKPLQAVFSEIRTSNKATIDSVYSLFIKEVSFDSLLIAFGGSLQKPISKGGSGLFGEVLFSLKQGEVSTPFENPNKTFSIVRLEKTIPEEPFSLNHVFSQIKQKIIKEKKDSIRLQIKDYLMHKNATILNKEILFF